jgi:NAD(P)-dependent dehydrogenase (short-subunit alcohol dehydrogenase family)
MSIADKTVLITGASRGIGQALVDEALRRGARQVYAAARRPASHPDERVTPLRMDVARAIFDAVDRGEEDIFPDPLARSLADGWRNGAVKALERQLAQIR